MQTTKKRGPFKALLLSLLVPGLGQLYNSHIKKAAAFFTFNNSIYILGYFTLTVHFSNTFHNFIFAVIVYSSLSITTIFSIFDAFKDAHQLDEIELTPYNKWYTYLAIGILQFILIALLHPTHNIANFTVAGDAMWPTIINGDKISASKIAYKTKKPERGDIAFFTPLNTPKQIFLMRVIGIPGDRISMINGQLLINDFPVLRRSTAAPQDTRGVYRGNKLKTFIETLPNGVEYQVVEDDNSNPMRNFPQTLVPPGHYFVLGDNRDNALDSRYLSTGFIPEQNFKGKPLYIYWSDDLNRIGMSFPN
ncbi:MAG: signal peptidase I [Methylocystaceae bacterium]|nr:signal peptidase I [Methylocystaceae bacterium]